jgi:hypothetical protein
MEADKIENKNNKSIDLHALPDEYYFGSNNCEKSSTF